MTLFSPKVPISPQKNMFLLFFYFFVQCLKKNDFFILFIFGPFLVLGPLQKRVNAPNMGSILKKNNLNPIPYKI